MTAQKKDPLNNQWVQGRSGEINSIPGGVNPFKGVVFIINVFESVINIIFQIF
ncbi:hypothetical protein P4T20_02180 [Aneurinibacillus thermoaerophilus]|uniref:hypothetical protein n=1 Tax=Aneurinibacillus thermoaerophilus TaxID=143495 RepID=UPI002E251F5B|nr:hypothetical protein [Aneurinibacillus thermoaerophilus]